MYRADKLREQDKTDFYPELGNILTALLGDEKDCLANMANFTGLLFHQMEDVNWVGFYILRGQDLVLGPYQGKPACTRIAVGKGVCGTAALGEETLVVPDVHQFPGHIACDACSRSELVVPFKFQQIQGVLDLDSPRPNRFSQADALGLEALLAMLHNHLDKNKRG